MFLALALVTGTSRNQRLLFSYNDENKKYFIENAMTENDGYIYK
jgi:hypothetical protein